MQNNLVVLQLGLVLGELRSNIPHSQIKIVLLINAVLKTTWIQEVK